MYYAKTNTIDNVSGIDLLSINKNFFNGCERKIFAIIMYQILHLTKYKVAVFILPILEEINRTNCLCQQQIELT